VPVHVLLLRAVNVGPRRLAMAELRSLLTAAGLVDVRTYLQSGNAVAISDEPPDALAHRCRRLISEHTGFDVPVVVRSRADLEAIVAHHPFGGQVNDPKLHWVTFFDEEPSAAALARLEALATDRERFVARGRELYAWLPDGAGRSKLAAALPAPVAELSGTARNWRTVLKLLEMARELEAAAAR
jgi:uncharacterized protein (DUF1697 family)